MWIPAGQHRPGNDTVLQVSGTTFRTAAVRCDLWQWIRPDSCGRQDYFAKLIMPPPTIPITIRAGHIYIHRMLAIERILDLASVGSGVSIDDVEPYRP